MTSKTWYKDAKTGARRHTRGRFVQWTSGGVFGFWYAAFDTGKGELFIPAWSIEADSRAQLPPKPPRENEDDDF